MVTGIGIGIMLSVLVGVSLIAYMCAKHRPENHEDDSNHRVSGEPNNSD